MSAFEFVIVAFSIVIGFGVSEILAGWGQLIRARARLAPFPLQFAATALLLILHLSYLWALWLSRQVEWTFPLYLLYAAPACILALCAHIMRADTAPGAEQLREQYFRSSRPAYALLALVPLLGIAVFVASGAGGGGGAPTLARTVGALILVSLSWSQSEKYHWAAPGSAWLIVLGLTSRLVFRLGEAAA